MPEKEKSDFSYEKYFDSSSKQSAFDKIAKRFFNKNFGSMQKSEIELLLFSIYTDQLSEIAKNDNSVKTDDYTISKELGITQRVVNNLKIKKELKYPCSDNSEWKDELPAIISNATFENGKIKLYIENPVVRMELEHILTINGNFADYSFNPHILSISPLCFLDILPFISKEKPQELKKSILNNFSKKSIGNDDLVKKIESGSFSKTLKEKGLDFALSLLSGIVVEAIPAGDILKEPLKELFTGIKNSVKTYSNKGIISPKKD